MTRTKLIAALLLTAPACAPESPTTETRQSAVSSISAWSNLAGFPGNTVASPTFARAPGGTWTAYKQSGNGLTYLTIETSPGSGVFGTTWTALSGSDSPFGGVAAVVLTNYNPARYLVAVTGWDDQVHVQVQDQAGATVYIPWHVIRPGAGLFLSAPSIAFAAHPRGSSTPSLMMVARGTDDRMYFSKNVMTSGVYTPSYWSAFALVSDTQYSSKPSVIEICGYPGIVQLSPYMMAARVPSDGSYVYHKYDGTTWGGAIPIVNGLFQTGPALACAQSASTPTTIEISVWGLGLAPGLAMWYSTQITGGYQGYQGFTSIGGPFNENVIPSAVASGQELRLGTTMNGLPYTATAVSP